jgi:undecaprenyl diphosphate synthase
MKVSKVLNTSNSSEFSQMPKIDGAKIPKHIAIIMDGNGRWANERGLSRLEGHRQGIAALRSILEAARDFNIRYLTVWAFSTENWRRPLTEVNSLMTLFRHYIKMELMELHENGIHLQFIGRRTGLPADILSMMNNAEQLTKDNTAFSLIIAFNYGGRDDIVRSVQALAQQVREGALLPENISEELLSSQLSTASVPDPDMMIRTGGETRISNFLLWQLSYTELVFTETYWPDFNKEDLARAIQEYQKRNRRYGALNSKKK